jgi:hypothetical protein
MNPASRSSDLIDMAFAPLRSLLQAPDVIEICINEPKRVFVEYMSGGGQPGMVALTMPDLTRERIRFMAERVAAASHQFVNEEEPLLSASLPDGSRVQVVLPPAAPDGGVIVIRRKVVRSLSLTHYVNAGALLSTRVTSGADELTDDDNVRGGVRYLKLLEKKYANPMYVLAAYNAGEAAVDDNRGIPLYPETVSYVAAILTDLYGWQSFSDRSVATNTHHQTKAAPDNPAEGSPETWS